MVIGQHTPFLLKTYAYVQRTSNQKYFYYKNKTIFCFYGRRSLASGPRLITRRQNVLLQSVQ